MDNLLLTDDALRIVEEATGDDRESARAYLTALLNDNQLRWRRAIDTLEEHGWASSDLLLAAKLLENTLFLSGCSGSDLKFELELAAGGAMEQTWARKRWLLRTLQQSDHAARALIELTLEMRRGNRECERVCRMAHGRARRRFGL